MRNFADNLLYESVYVSPYFLLGLVETWIPFPGYKQVKDSYAIGQQRDFELEFLTRYYIIRQIR
jgi:hypothetical protein